MAVDLDKAKALVVKWRSDLKGGGRRLSSDASFAALLLITDLGAEVERLREDVKERERMLLEMDALEG